jgi:hypothetical protein
VTLPGAADVEQRPVNSHGNFRPAEARDASPRCQSRGDPLFALPGSFGSLKRFPPTASDERERARRRRPVARRPSRIAGLLLSGVRGIPAPAQTPLVARRRARSASASSSAAERRRGVDPSSVSVSAAAGEGAGVGVRAARLPSAGVGRMRNRRRYWRSQRGPQNQPAPARKTPPEARSSSSVEPAMAVRQPTQCWPCGTSSCFAARERIHFITTASTPSPPLLDDNRGSGREPRTESHRPPGDCTPPGCSRPLSSTQGEWVEAPRLFPSSSSTA